MKQIITIIILVLSTVISYGQKSQKFSDGIYGEDYTNIDIKEVGKSEFPDVILAGSFEFYKEGDYKFTTGTENYYCPIICYSKHPLLDKYGISLSAPEVIQLKKSVRMAFQKQFGNGYSIEVLTLAHTYTFRDGVRSYDNCSYGKIDRIKVIVKDLRIEKAKEQEKIAKQRERDRVVSSLINF